MTTRTNELTYTNRRFLDAIEDHVVIYDGATYQTVPGGQCLTATGPIQVNTYVDCF